MTDVLRECHKPKDTSEVKDDCVGSDRTGRCCAGMRLWNGVAVRCERPEMQKSYGNGFLAEDAEKGGKELRSL